MTPLEFSVQDGQRILCLDGGGLKGLILIEVLLYIEHQAGRKITELFDWIVGTSTGGIIALALVYGT
jgi:calcium-independent phospholipase A2